MSTSLNAPASTLAPSLRNQRVSLTEYYDGVSKRFQEVKFLGLFPGQGAAPPTLSGPLAPTPGDAAAALEGGGAAALSAPPPKGALAGVPLVVSNDIDVKDSATHCGVEGLKCAVAEADAPVLASLRARGAHLLGQVTGSELSLSLASPHIAKNPFTAFGLAGGSAAAAVAARVATLGVAVDTLGSARASAALCGVTAFRPTHGRYTRGGTLGLSSTLSTPVALARTVRDLQLVDAVLSTAAAEAVMGGGAEVAAAAAASTSSEREQPAAEDAAAGAPQDAKELATVKMQSAARGFISRRRVQKARSGAPGALERAEGGFATPSKGEAMRAARYAAQLETSTARLEALEAGVEGVALTPAPAVVVASESGSGEADSSSSGPLSPGSSTPVLPTGMAFSADLLGLRIGVPRRTSPFFSNLPTGLAAVVEAALSRLSKAGAELVEVDVDEGLSHSEGGSVCALATSAAHTILGYEAPREIASYAYCRSVPQPKPVKVVVEGEEEEEAAAEEGGDEEGGAAAAAATPIPPTLVPLDTLVAPSVLLRAYKGPSAYTTLLTGQLSHKAPTFVTATAYRSAVVHSRLAVRRCFTTLFKRNRLAALLYPATKLPPAPLKGAEGLSVELPNGTTADATEAYLANLYPASVAGMPCVVVPCGLTKPRSGAPPGSMDAERLPVALEFIGLPNADEALLALAAAFQRLAPLLADPIVVAAFKTGVARDVE